MYFRLITKSFLYGAVFAAGYSAPTEWFTGATARYAAIFLGLVSASILPTITLVINGISAGSRSVLALNNLKDQVDLSIRALLFLLGLVGVLVVGLAAASIDLPPMQILINGTGMQLDLTFLLSSCFQGISTLALVMLLLRVGQIPAILKATANARFEVAKDEAVLRLHDRAPTRDQVAELFPTTDNFGQTKKVEPITAG